MKIGFPYFSVKGNTIRSAVLFLREHGIYFYYINFNDYNNSNYVVVA